MPSKRTWNELRGAYRVRHADQATPERITAPYFMQVRQEMARQPLVLVVHDTTELDFTAHRARRGTGPVGRHGRGFLQPNSLAVTPDGRRLGLAHQPLVLRPSAPTQATQAGGRRRADRRTVRDFVHGVARLGGFLGRRGDGSPGSRSGWRGYQRLQDMVAGIQWRAATPPTNGGCRHPPAE